MERKTRKVEGFKEIINVGRSEEVVGTERRLIRQKDLPQSHRTVYFSVTHEMVD